MLAIEHALPPEIKGRYKIHPPGSGNLWMVLYNCPNPVCTCADRLPKDKAHKKWVKSSTIAGHAAALRQAVLSKHGKCFDALRCEDCGEELSTVDAEKSLAITANVLKNKARKIEELEVEVHVHP